MTEDLCKDGISSGVEVTDTQKVGFARATQSGLNWSSKVVGPSVPDEKVEENTLIKVSK